MFVRLVCCSIWLAILLVIAIGVPLKEVSAVTVWRAVMVGPHYPGGDPFDDIIAGVRMTALRNQFAQWANWDAANITLLSGAVTTDQIAQAIAGANVDGDDFFTFVYHGHGSYTRAPLPGGNPIGDPQEELYVTPGNVPAGWMSDDAFAAAIAALPATATKLVINLSCYGGGFWNDLLGLNSIAFYSGAGETQTLSEPPQFYTNLFNNADPNNIGRVDTNVDGRISISEYYQASAAVGAFFGHRWMENFDELFDEIVWSSFESQYNKSSEGLDYETLFVPIPEPSTLLLLGSGLVVIFVFGRKRLFKKTRP